MLIITHNNDDDIWICSAEPQLIVLNLQMINSFNLSIKYHSKNDIASKLQKGLIKQNMHVYSFFPVTNMFGTIARNDILHGIEYVQ